jgi:LemA protein
VKILGEERGDPFFLKDETGQVIVDPAKAELQSKHSRREELSDPHPLYRESCEKVKGQGERRRFIEIPILPGDSLYVMGTANPGPDGSAPLVGHDPDDDFFLISNEGESKAARTYSILGWAALGGSLVALYLLAILIQAYWKPFAYVTVGVASAPLIFFVVQLALMYTLFLYNDVIDVHQRVRRAWGMIDVELKRRCDLIPNLVTVVKAFAKHERDLQVGTAQARTGSVSEVSRSVQGQNAALRSAFVIVERYPEMKTDEVFRKLMGELQQTENRISYTREFYNNSIQSYNNRVQQFPDMILAKLGGFKPRESLSILEFEKKPIEVAVS